MSEPDSRTDRGLATQVDFLTSMVIRLAAFGLVMTVGTSLLYGALATEYTNDAVAERAAARLADDLLVTSPGDALLNASCTRAFFAREVGPCGVEPAWRDDSIPYLNAALAVGPPRRLNVTLTDRNGTIGSLDGVRLALGDPHPTQSSTRRRWHRQVGLPTSGAVDWYRLTVVVWGR